MAGDAGDCFFGEQGGAPAVELYYENAAGTSVMAVDGAEIPLVQPPQGGWVFYVSPHVKNMDSCELQLTTSLIDICTNEVVVVESRPVTLEPDGTGYVVPINSSNEGIVAACPQSMISRNLDGAPYLIDQIVTDRSGRMAEAKIQVTPVCSDPFCTCQCNRTYKLGDTCSTDGGVSDAGVGSRDGAVVDAGVSDATCPGT